MSNLGKGDRQLWYENQPKDPTDEVLSPQTKLKFLIGDIWEALLLFLAKEAGHTVELEQAEVELNGILGHIDAVIDGTVVDVKSASSYAFRKFQNGTLAQDDPFGYMEQMAGYSTALGGLDGVFLAVNKESAKMALFKVPAEASAALDIGERIVHLKDVVASETAPERCYQSVPFGEGGNEILGVNCSYCPFKKRCWADVNNGMGLRTFVYSDGLKHFTKVVKEPRVTELTWSQDT